MHAYNKGGAVQNGIVGARQVGSFHTKIDSFKRFETQVTQNHRDDDDDAAPSLPPSLRPDWDILYYSRTRTRTVHASAEPLHHRAFERCCVSEDLTAVYLGWHQRGRAEGEVHV